MVKWRMGGSGLKWCSSRHEIRIFCAATSPEAQRPAIATSNVQHGIASASTAPSIEGKKKGDRKKYFDK